jgi:hypothetical protein
MGDIKNSYKDNKLYLKKDDMKLQTGFIWNRTLSKDGALSMQ